MKNRLSIKNVKFSEALSEETNAYVADVYLDNKKFGYARNDGRGGSTSINAYPDKKDLLREAEEYVSTLPKQEVAGFNIKLSMDSVVDMLLVELLERKELKKEMTKGIVYKDKEGSIKLTRWNISLKKVLDHPKGNEMVKAAILEIENEGGEILNTNLPKEIWK